MQDIIMETDTHTEIIPFREVEPVNWSALSFQDQQGKIN